MSDDGTTWVSHRPFRDRPSGDGDDTWTHSWWCSGDMSDCRFNGCKPPPVSGVAGNPEEAGEK